MYGRYRKELGSFATMLRLLVLATVFWALAQSALADPIYVGASGPTHSWASGWFEESHPRSPGVFDQIQLQVDTRRSPDATFELGSTQLSPGWQVVSNSSKVFIADSSSAAAARTLFFDLVFNKTPPNFVGIYFQLFSGTKVVENGYFYRGGGESIPGGQYVGGGWSYTTQMELPAVRLSPDTRSLNPVPEPPVAAGLLGLLAVGLVALWRSRRRPAKIVDAVRVS